MAFEFRNIEHPCAGGALQVDFRLMEGILAGFTTFEGWGLSELMRLAARLDQPQTGSVEGPVAHYVGPSFHSTDAAEIRRAVDDAIRLKPSALGLGPTLALTDAGYREGLPARLRELQREGSTVLLVSHDLGTLERHCDEVILLRGGRIERQGDPVEIVEFYRRQIVELNRGTAGAPPLQPASRHGDGRAAIPRVKILGASGEPTDHLSSGEDACARISVEFREAVASPVVGILIRSRVGVNVYGTNTELERADIGGCAGGETIEVNYRFRVDLCPGEYTLTVASHDPDGTAHEWLEDAVLFTVSDSRYTAGVANLRARVEVRRPQG